MKWFKEEQKYKYEKPNSNVLKTFSNPGVQEVTFTCKEFTSLCPITGQPDYGEIKIYYKPKKKCIESKSLKLYLRAYRQYKGFAEKTTENIFQDLRKVLGPINILVVGKFASRGGIEIETSIGG